MRRLTRDEPCPSDNSRRAQARRRSVRSRPVEDPDRPPRRARRDRCRPDGHVPPPGPREEHRRPGAGRSRGPVRPARGLRGGAGQRWRDGLLGHRDLRPDREEEPAPQLRRVLVQVRQGRRAGAVARRPVGDQVRAGQPSRCGRRGRRRRLRLGAQRDLDRGHGADRAPRGCRRGRARAHRRHVRRRWPARRPQPGRHLLLRPAEVLRLGRWPLDRADVAGRPRAGRADRRERPAHPGVLRPADRDRQLSRRTRPTTPRRSPPSS